MQRTDRGGSAGPLLLALSLLLTTMAPGVGLDAELGDPTTFIPPGPSSSSEKPLFYMDTFDNIVQIESVGEPTTLDPAVAYDDFSNTVTQAVYETLFTYDGAAADQFVPLLAASVPTIGNGGISNNNTTYTFPVRLGVTFHSGDSFDAYDVAFSFKRVIDIDDPAGPAWMLSQIMTNASVVALNSSTVQITLTRPYGGLLAILSSPVAAIVSNDTVQANGGLVYHQVNAWMVTHEDGTGPFRLTTWTPGTEVILDPFGGYWNGSRMPSVARVRLATVSNSSTQISDLQAGLASTIQVSGVNRASVAAIAAAPGSGLNASSGTSSWAVTMGAFNRALNVSMRPLLGAVPSPDNVPSDFMTDAKLRAAFANAFNYADFLANGTNVTSTRPSGILPQGMYGANSSGVMAAFDLAAARLAYNQTRWVLNSTYNPGGYAGGFNLSVAYNAGNYPRQKMMEILKAGVEALGPNINVNVVGLTFGTYLSVTTSTASGGPGPLGCFAVSWGPDYADPDDYVFPFAKTGSFYPQFMGYSNLTIDGWINQAAGMANDPLRRALYEQIDQALVDENVYLLAGEGTNFHVANASLAGWYYNPMLAGRDVGGDLSSLFWIVPPDVVQPSVSISSPVTGSWAVGPLVNVSGTATDDRAWLDVQVRVDNGTWMNSSPVSATNVNWSYSFSLALGSHAAEALALDGAGNFATATSYFEVLSAPPDTVPPTILSVSPANGTRLQGTELNLSGSTSDDRAVATVQVRVDGGLWSQAASGNQTPLNWSMNFTLSPGVHFVEINVTDFAGNFVVGGLTVELGIPPPDTVPPVVGNLSLASGTKLQGTQLNLSGSALDDQSVALVQVRVDNGTWAPVASGNQTILNWSTSLALSPGVHLIEVNVTDGAGNSAISGITVEMGVPPPDAGPPTVVILSPANGAKLHATQVNVVGIASDDLPGITVQVRVDNGTWSTIAQVNATEVNWSTSLMLAAGTHFVEVNASDLLGNSDLAGVTIETGVQDAQPTGNETEIPTWVIVGLVVGSVATASAVITITRPKRPRREEPEPVPGDVPRKREELATAVAAIHRGGKVLYFGAYIETGDAQLDAELESSFVTYASRMAEDAFKGADVPDAEPFGGGSGQVHRAWGKSLFVGVLATGLPDAKFQEDLKRAIAKIEYTYPDDRILAAPAGEVSQMIDQLLKPLWTNVTL